MNAPSRLRLAVFDVDGTLRRAVSPWRLLHQRFAVAGKAGEYFLRYERGEIDSAQWARLDAALWAGRGREEFLASLVDSPLRAGARELVAWLRRRSVECLGVSTGLSVLNRVTAEELGLSEVISNDLGFRGGVCDGTVSVRVTETTKGDVLDAILRDRGLSRQQVVSFGDGEADVALFERSGLSFAVFARSERVRAAAGHCLDREPIDSAIALLQAYG